MTRPNDRDTPPGEIIARPLDPDEFALTPFSSDTVHGLREAGMLVFGMLTGFARASVTPDHEAVTTPELVAGAVRLEQSTWRLVASAIITACDADDVPGVPDDAAPGGYYVAPAAAAAAMIEAAADMCKPPGWSGPTDEVCTCEDDPPHVHVGGAAPMWVGPDGVARTMDQLPDDAPRAQLLAGQLIAARLNNDPDTWYALLAASVLPDEPTGSWIYRVALPVMSVFSASFSSTTLDGHTPTVPDDDRSSEAPDDASELTIADTLGQLAERGDLEAAGVDEHGNPTYRMTEQGRRRVEGMGAQHDDAAEEPDGGV